MSILRLLASCMLCVFSAGASTVCNAAPVGRGYICAEGGGSATGGTWATAVFSWMVQNGNNGDVVILGVRDADDTIANVFLSCGARSASNLAITQANADSQDVFDAITAANIVWIRGGAQSSYVKWWKGTATERAIRSVYEKGGVVGGTSAGCAIMGEVIYDAIGGSLQPRDALQNPFHPSLTLTTDFLRLTPGVLFDTHFTERGRIGRLFVMLARHWQATQHDILGIGVDDRTALCIDPNGIAEVCGDGSVTIMHRTAATQQVIMPNEPPVMTNIAYTQLVQGYAYDLNARRVLVRPAGASVSRTHPDNKVEFQSIRVNGSLIEDRIKGALWVDDGGDERALFTGKLAMRVGENKLPQTIVSTATWSDRSFVDNRIGGVQWGLAQRSHWLGLYVDAGTTISARPPALFEIIRSTPEHETATLVLDTHGMTSRAFAMHVSNAESAGPRQSVAIEGATLHAMRSGMVYSALVHQPVHRADLNGDGTIDVRDLVSLASAWGPCTAVCAADNDRDGIVGKMDLDAMLARWNNSR